jgi:hypothetical protein
VWFEEGISEDSRNAGKKFGNQKNKKGKSASSLFPDFLPF